MQVLRQFGFEIGKLPALLCHLSTILVVFEAHQHLSGLHLVTLINADPGHSAVDLRSNFDLVRSDDVAGRSQDHLLASRISVHGRLHLYDLDRHGRV